jgi:hypothetical protein
MPGQTVFPYNCKILSRTQITLRAGAALVESGPLFGLQDTGRGPVLAGAARSMAMLDRPRAAFSRCSSLIRHTIGQPSTFARWTRGWPEGRIPMGLNRRH